MQHLSVQVCFGEGRDREPETGYCGVVRNRVNFKQLEVLHLLVLNSFFFFLVSRK